MQNKNISSGCAHQNKGNSSVVLQSLGLSGSGMVMSLESRGELFHESMMELSQLCHALHTHEAQNSLVFLQTN